MFIAIFASALLQGSDAFNITSEFVQVIYHVQVDGSTSLPDPGPLNAFLQGNESLFNPLFPDHPPVQLQICNASVYQTPVNFYSIQHPGGCGIAPGWGKKPDPDHDKLVHTYEILCLVWNTGLFGLVILFLIGRRISDQFKNLTKSMGEWLGLRSELDDPEFEHDECSASVVISLLGAIWPGSILYILVFGSIRMSLVSLPDPTSFRHVLASSGQNVTLYLCTIRDLFQVYIGFADSCQQLQELLYPEALPPAHFNNARGAGMFVLMLTASMLMWGSGVFIAMKLVKFFFCACGPCRGIEALIEKRHQQSKVYGDLEMQGLPDSETGVLSEGQL